MIAIEFKLWTCEWIKKSIGLSLYSSLLGESQYFFLIYSQFIVFSVFCHLICRPKVSIIGSREQLCINNEVLKQETNSGKVSKEISVFEQHNSMENKH